MKKFCSDCKYFEEGSKIYNLPLDQNRTEDRCMNPNNFRDDYLSEKRISLSTPVIINRFNDCTWFELKNEVPF